MAKTRDDKFKLVFDSFIRDTIGVDKYNLENLTKNKTENTHIYSFTIHSQIKIIGYIDRNGLNENNNENLKPIEHQYIPNEETVRDQINEKFGPYEFTKTYISYGTARPYTTRLSYVDIDRCHINDNNGITGKLVVIYYKSHIPYEVQEDDREFEKKYLNLLRRFNKLEDENMELSDNIDDLNEDLHTTKRQVRNLRKRMIKEEELHLRHEKNFKNKLREAYSKEDILEDCPVCYEQLSMDTLIIPNCTHSICNSCQPRCDVCPICRTDYLEDET